MRTITDGFTMCPDKIVAQRGLACAATFGKVIRYESMPDGECSASQARIAKELNISVRAVSDHLKWLTQEGYIKIVLYPRGGTKHYVSTEKIHMVVGVSDTPIYGDETLVPLHLVQTPPANGAAVPLQEVQRKIVVKDTSQESIKDSGKNAAPPEPEYVDDVEAPKRNGKVPEALTQPMIAALGKVLAWDMSISSNWAKLGKLARTLAGSKYTPEQITQIFGPGGTWYSHDWRGKKGELPNTKAIPEEIGKLSGRIFSPGKQDAKARLQGRIERFGEK